MNLHEYQAKDLFRSYGIPVPPGRVAASAQQAAEAAAALGGSLWVVKAQVHAGGRGKAGGVKLARDVEAVRVAARGMLGERLVTPQTGPEGLPVERVYVESGSDIAREMYLSLTLNRERATHRAHRLARRRHGYRGGGPQDTREDPRRSLFTRRRDCRLTKRASSPSAWNCPARSSASSSRSRPRSTGCISRRT